MQFTLPSYRMHLLSIMRNRRPSRRRAEMRMGSSSLSYSRTQIEEGSRLGQLKSLQRNLWEMEWI